MRHKLLIVGLVGLYAWSALGWGGPDQDLQVYRLGVRTWVDGRDLYGPLAGTDLVFTYPPVAALATAPFAALGLRLAAVLLATTGLAGLLRCLYRLGWSPGWAMVVVLTDPVRTTIGYGQLNLVLVALVVTDCLAPRRAQGWRVGLAAAIKLTPAIFILYFLVKGQYRAAATAAATFVLSNVVALLIMPATVVHYWHDCFPGVQRIGSAWFAANESWWALLSRAHTPHAVPIWCGLSVITLGLLGRALRRVPDDWGVLLTGVAGLLVSPISWSHHWIWGVLAAYALARCAPRWGALAFMPFLLAPQWWFPRAADRELSWSTAVQLLASAYLLVAFVALVIGAGRRRSAALNSAP